MFTSKSQRDGSTRSLRRVIGPVSGIVLVLMLTGGVNGRQLPVDDPGTRVVHPGTDRMIYMLKLKTVEGQRVLVYG